MFLLERSVAWNALWPGAPRGLERMVAQSATRGAYPLALAAADPLAEGGVYYGPTGFQDMRGKVGRSKVATHARDTAVAKRLWEVSESLVGPFEVS